MERKLNRLSGLMVFGAAACLLAVPAGAREENDHVAGRLLFEPAAGADPSAIAQVLARHGAGTRRGRPAAPSAVAVGEQSSAAVMESLRGTGLFRYVERDYYAHTARTPDDALFESQWHLAQIQAREAWDITTGAAGAVIAVIDSGVDAAHPDLAARLAKGWSFLKDSDDVSDTMGHGTAVAGVAGAASDNHTGVAGVTWVNRIMPLAVVTADDRASYSDIAAAIRYAADHGARVLNISLGGPNPSEALQGAVDYAWSKGALIFGSAMNNGVSTPHYPAACRNVVAVSATDVYEGLAGFSNYGNWITLAAPGAGILSTNRGGGYGYWNGTSFASPMAAGVAALVLSINPALGPGEVLAIMRQSADDLGAPGFDERFGWGRINAAKAIRAAKATLANAPAAAPLAITPARASLAPGAAQQFAAAESVTWSISSGAGAISASGLYQAPPAVAFAQSVIVTAASTANPARTATAVVMLDPAPLGRNGERGAERSSGGSGRAR